VGQAINIPITMVVEISGETMEQGASHALTPMIRMNLHRPKHGRLVFHAITYTADQFASFHGEKEKIVGACSAAGSIERVEGIDKTCDFSSLLKVDFKVFHGIREARRRKSVR